MTLIFIQKCNIIDKRLLGVAIKAIKFLISHLDFEKRAFAKNKTPTVDKKLASEKAIGKK